jgi:lipoyl(octanoyl) transferase
MSLPRLELWVDTIPRDPASQMAVDEALMRLCPGRPVLRHYRWEGQPASFGRSQSIAWATTSAPGRKLVRRWTGGGLVFHGEDLTFSLFVPGDMALARRRPRESYSYIHSRVAAALQSRGVECRLVAECDGRSGDDCFAAPVAFDVVGRGGRKLCGGAQRRTRVGFLHQGSIQNCGVSADIFEDIAHAIAGDVCEFEVPRPLWEEVAGLVEARYGNPAWTARVP